MKIIKIAANTNGSHDNQQSDGLTVCPTGWAVIPDNINTPNFPFGEIEVADVDGVLTVIAWTARGLPPDEPAEPTESEDMAAMLVEHEYRLTLIELGVTV